MAFLGCPRQVRIGSMPPSHDLTQLQSLFDSLALPVGTESLFQEHRDLAKGRRYSPNDYIPIGAPA